MHHDVDKCPGMDTFHQNNIYNFFDNFKANF